MLAISGADACLFRNGEAIYGLGDKAPRVVMTMTGLCFIRTERNPADTLVCLKLYDAGLNRAVEIFRRETGPLARLSAGVSLKTSLTVTSQFGHAVASESD